MSDTTYETILLDTDAGVATLTLNRPEHLNAFNGKMSAELPRALLALEADDSVRCIVVTGAGRVFSAGADLGGGGGTFASEGYEQRIEQAGEGGIVPARPWEMSTPIIAAMQGSAVGMGLTVPCQWDVRYMCEDAKYGFVFNRRGIMPEAGSQWIVPRLIGMSRSMELLLSGRYFSGREAAEIGLASKALPAGEVLPAALELAHDIAENTAPLSVAMTKRLVYRLLQETDQQKAAQIETKLFWWIGNQADAQEGVRAFLDKRAPKWTLSKTGDLPDELR